MTRLFLLTHTGDLLQQESFPLIDGRIKGYKEMILTCCRSQSWRWLSVWAQKAHPAGGCQTGSENAIQWGRRSCHGLSWTSHVCRPVSENRRMNICTAWMQENISDFFSVCFCVSLTTYKSLHIVAHSRSVVVTSWTRGSSVGMTVSFCLQRKWRNVKESVSSLPHKFKTQKVFGLNNVGFL